MHALIIRRARPRSRACRGLLSEQGVGSQAQAVHALVVWRARPRSRARRGLLGEQ